MVMCLVALRCYRNLLGNGPQKSYEFTGDGHDHLVGMFPSGHQVAIALAQPHLRLPTAVLDRLWELLQPELSVATDFGGIPVGPGAFDEGTTRMGMAGVGDPPLTPPLTAGIC